MFGIAFSKILIKFFIACSVTLSLILVSGYDTSSENLKTFEFRDYINEIKPYFQKDNSLPEFDGDLDVLEESYVQEEVITDIKNNKEVLIGTASHYANKFHGRLTANGEIFNMYDYSCAHKELPFGTIIKVTNQNNGLATLVRVNDRGPYVNDRIIDLSFQAAKSIDNLGLPKIKAEYIKVTEYNENEKLFLAYSTNKEISELSPNEFDEIAKIKDFSEAVEFYEETKKNSNINNIYLIVPKISNPKEFIIGSAKTNQLFAQN